MIRIWSLMIFGTSLLVSGCSTKQMLTESAMYQQYPSVETLKNQLAEAKTQELDLLSPLAFKRADKSYSEAVKLASKDNEKGDAIARDGISQLAVARTNADEARYILEELLAARSNSIAAGAVGRQTYQFGEVEKDLLALTTLIESGKTSKAKDARSKVMNAYQNLELAALKTDTVEHARQSLAEARKRDADNVAPKTFKIAEEEYQLALNILDADRNDKLKAESHAQRSLWHAQQAGQIAETLRHFKSSGYSEEDKVLWYQDQISKIVSPINNEVAYNLSNKELVKELTADIQGLVDSNLTLVGELEATAAGKQRATEEKEKALMLSRLQIQKLAEEKEKALMLSKLEIQKNEEVSSKFNFVQSLFKQDEAEVYRQNNDVLIRAHGFYFPSGGSEIQSTNFALLKKITEAINTFPGAKIIVSGHTDNTGSDELNMLLSQDRAEKVAEFLNQVGNIPRDRIEFHGFGKQKPVLSNENKEGRAANRRVEILIVNDSPRVQGAS